MGKREDEARLRDYDGLEPPLADGFSDDPKRTVQWYHWLIYDIRARIVYATLLALVLGVGIPLMIYYLVLEKKDQVTYGSCLINEGFRFECLLNRERPPTEDECIAAMCCFAAEEEVVPFRCYHFFTPAYQYFVDSLNQTDPEQVIMRLRPKYGQNILTDLDLKLRWKSPTQLTLSLQDPAKARLKGHTNERESVSRDTTDEDVNLYADELDPLGPFDVSYSQEGEYFFIRMRRNDTDETLFDTRLGPISSDEDSLSFATVLPTKWFYGLKGGQDNGGLVYEVVNGYGSLELPFYLALEADGRAHGVLIETHAPFITQVVTAPGIMFHFQGPDVGVELHFFVGPTPKDVFEQLHAHLEEMEGGRRAEMPPYWALGLHLCREAGNETEVYEAMCELTGNETRAGIPYDSDCIERQLRTPFDLDSDRFSPTSTFKDILEHLNSTNKRLLLTQSIGLFNTTYEEVMDEGGALIMQESGGEPFMGILRDMPVFYPDFMQNGTKAWLETKLEALSQIEFQASGLVLIDNFPRTENLTASDCFNDTMGDGTTKTRLEERFSQEADGAGLVCPEALHGSKSHFQVHNAFGHAGLAQLSAAFKGQSSGERVLLASTSVWTHSSVYGGYSGLEVPFTWAGMMESLDHLLRNFMLLPFSGTPICGSYASVQDEVDTAGELCLRWFQLGLLLPFARNSHGPEGSRGPLDLSLKYQNYLVEAIRTRYTYSPYYYTAYYLNTLQREPLVRPLIYDFLGSAPTQNMAAIMTQFMIGPALMAAPVLQPATTRTVYFPPGKWYNAYGDLVVSAEGQGTTLTISSLLSETPLFIRGGHIIPILNEPEGNNAVESRAGNYTILATLPPTLTKPSIGELFVDDGVSSNSLELGNFDHVTFTTTQTEFHLKTTTCIAADTESISRIITEIRIFGFPTNQEAVEVESSDQSFNFKYLLEGESGVLVIYDMDLHWCERTEITFTWTPPTSQTRN